MKKKYLLQAIEAQAEEKDGKKVYDDYHFTGARDYHEPEEIMDIIREVLEYEEEEELSETDDLRDAINDQADSATPVYNHALAEWFGQNWQAYDEVAEEFGQDGMGDNIMRGIAMAYCYTLERECMEALGEVWKEAEELESADDNE